MDSCLPDPPLPVRIPRPNPIDNPTASCTSPPKDAITNERGHSPAITLPSALPDAEKNDRRVEIAVEHYNKKKGKNYELGHVLGGNGFRKGKGTKDELALCSNGFIYNGNWFHCNFEAKQPNHKSHRLFFAELQGHITPETETWAVTCCTILKGTVNVGCKLCSNVVHPTYGFRQGLKKPKFSKVKKSKPRLSPRISTHMPSLDFLPGGSGLLRGWSCSPDSSPGYSSSYGLSDSVDEVLCAERREIMRLALEYYNKENDTNYQFVKGWNSNEFVRDGWWCHCNFTAKLPDSDIPPEFFIAEALLTDSEARTWNVTACVILDMENRKFRSGCYWCREVIHPIAPPRGFVKGYGSE